MTVAHEPSSPPVVERLPDLCVCLEPRRRRVDAISIVPFQQFLDALWAGELVA